MGKPSIYMSAIQFSMKQVGFPLLPFKKPSAKRAPVPWPPFEPTPKRFTLERRIHSSVPPGFLRVASISILSRDPDLSRKPPNTLGKQRSVFEKNDG